MSKKTVFLGRAYVGNSDIRVFHFTGEVSQSRIERFERPIRTSSREYLNAIGILGEAVVRRLFTIEGVSLVVMEPYQISIHKAPMFSWEGRNGLERQIVRAFREVFRDHKITLKATGTLVQRRERKPAQTVQPE